jgi:hypothetical protein
MTSHTWATALVMLLANVLPMFGVQVATEDLTTTITTLINIAGPIYIWLRGWWTGHFTLGGTRLSR